MAPLKQLLKRKYLYRALKKLTEGKAWRHINLRFEREVDGGSAEEHRVVRVSQHSHITDETKVRIVELKVRIPWTEYILGLQTLERQNVTALLL